MNKTFYGYTHCNRLPCSVLSPRISACSFRSRFIMELISWLAIDNELVLGLELPNIQMATIRFNHRLLKEVGRTRGEY